MADEDDPTKDLPEPRTRDTQPNLEKMIVEYFGVRDELMRRFDALESSVKVEVAGLRADVRKLSLKIEAYGNRLGHFEEDLVEIRERVTTLEEQRQ